VRENRGRTSDQEEVWKEVDRLHATHQVESGTGAISDAFETLKFQLAFMRSQLRYVEGASGLAVAIGEQVLSVDLFDKPSTCRKVGDRLLSGVMFDALEAGATDQHASVTAVENCLA
jgi:hypothetical protein